MTAKEFYEAALRQAGGLSSNIMSAKPMCFICCEGPELWGLSLRMAAILQVSGYKSQNMFMRVL